MNQDELQALYHLVVGTDMPEPYKLAAFSALLRSGGRAGSGSAGTSAAASVAAPAALGTDNPVESVASGLGISVEDARALFEFVEEGPRLSVPSRYVPVSKVQATRDFSVLITRARELVNLETAGEDIRKALDRHARYDRSNFSKHLDSVDPQFLNYQKASKKLVLRLPGREEAARIAQQYLGGGQ